ncbi:MAG: hypothetical protein PHF72_11940 [Gammaproteobacteria bacterium]|nr:hypothetical protein [Gammaproteobacteria bacterium]
MSSTAMDLLTWVRGPGFVIAVAIFLFGIVLRLIEIYSLGRKPDLAVARTESRGSGGRTILGRSLPPEGMLKRSPITYIGGYIFHIGLFITVLLFEPHIELIRNLIGISWPGLPSPVVDAAAIISIIALIVVLANRITDPVKRFLSNFEDYLTWTLTLLPLLTGYLAYHHLFLNYTLMLALHILTVELLLVALPFTKLFHTFSLFAARWYNGDISGRKGVAS